MYKTNHRISQEKNFFTDEKHDEQSENFLKKNKNIRINSQNAQII